jgi:hypothetical protein
MPVPRPRRREVPVDYVVVRETTLDGTDGLDGFESIPRPSTIDDILRSNETQQRRQVQPTPTSVVDDSDSDDDDDDEEDDDNLAPTPVRTIDDRGR